MGGEIVKVIDSIPIKLLTSDCKAIVIYGKFSSTLNLSYTNRIRILIYFPYKDISQLVEHCLKDNSVFYSRSARIPSFVFTQAIAKFSYVWHVYTLLAHYCKQLPRLSHNKRNGTLTSAITVITRAYLSITFLHELFM